MKGWRPSPLAKARNRFGLWCSGRILAGHRIDRPVFSPGFPFSRAHQVLRLRRSGGKGAHTSAILKKAPALHLLREDRRAPKGGIWQRKRKKGRGVSVTP